MTPTYPTYLAAALGVPLAVAAAAAWYRGGLRTRTDAVGVGVLAAIAVAYTFPWDGYLITRGVWWYGDGVVTARVWVVPAGELSFIVLQTVFAGLCLSAADLSPDPTRPDRTRSRRVGLGVVAALAVAGVASLLVPRGRYLGYVLVWASPVLGFLWFVGGPVIWRARRTAALAIAVPTAYLWVVDRVAIGLGLWTISPAHSTGITVAGLPVEELAFFLVTNAMVVFGLVLYRWVVARTETRSLAESLKGLLPRRGVRDPGGAARK